MSWRNRKRVLEGVILILGGLAGLVLIWYGYFSLQKATLSQAVLGTLFCGSCILAGLVALTLKDPGTRWFIVDAKHLNTTQSCILATGGLLFAVCSLWLAIQTDIPVLGHPIGRMILYIGFFFFGWIAVITLKRAFQRR